MATPLSVTDGRLLADACHEAHHAMYPAWSRDFLLCHPAAAMNLCRAVRRRMHRPRLLDEEILWTWLNAHKRGRLGKADVA